MQAALCVCVFVCVFVCVCVCVCDLGDAVARLEIYTCLSSIDANSFVCVCVCVCVYV